MKKIRSTKGLLIVTSLLLSANLFASNQNTSTWTVRPYFGISQMSDLSAQTIGVGTADGNVQVNLDSGFAAGLGFGYQINQNWTAELAWEYRSNDSETTLADGSIFTEGNYASNLFMLNTAYNFPASGKWQPYVGAGLTWLQEVDIDLESNGNEQSYSGDGNIGFQIFGGINYPIAQKWDLQGELRYGSITGIDLVGEQNANGSFTDMDYKTTTVQIGLTYQF